MNDLRLVLEAGFDETIILASISDYHIYYKLGTDRGRAFEKYLSVLEEAFRRGIAVRCALEDVTRADFDNNIGPFVERVMRLSEKYGVPLRFKLSDTLGLGLPFPEVQPPRGIPALIRRLLDLGLSTNQLEFHGHNDFGLVVANHLAAWIYGADYSNCTLFGIGERAGNCPLEVMLVHYVGLTGRANDVNLSVLPEVAAFFEKIGYRVPEFLPLVGRNAFNTKAGIHIDGLLKNPEIYLPFDPLLVGRRPRIEVNAYGGRAAIVAWIRLNMPELGKSISKDDLRVEEMYREIVRMYEEGGRKEPLSDEELYELTLRYFLGGTRHS
jgi:isopropylmalate/homocitrate/citramalate synthase